MEMTFKVKKDGKFVTVARFGLNKFGNKRLSIHKPTFIDLLKSEGDWADLSVFEDKAEVPAQADPVEGIRDDTIPF